MSLDGFFESKNAVHLTNTDFIKESIKNLTQDIDTLTNKGYLLELYKDDLAKRYSKFHKQFPFFFNFTLTEYLTDKKTYYKHLNELLQIIIDLQESKLTSLQAETKFGKLLGEKYLPK